MYSEVDIYIRTLKSRCNWYDLLYQLRLQVMLQWKNRIIHRDVFRINIDNICGGTDVNGNGGGLLGSPNRGFYIYFFNKKSEAS